MSDLKKNTSRNLPSWMSSQENTSSKSQAKNPTDVSVNENRNVGGSSTTSRENEKAPETNNPSKNENRRRKSESDQGIASFSRLMEGVVFALSGFVNPERGMLRTQALEMGAEYQPDWNSNCTLLICAFANTPKCRQVKAECGTIVSKEWISECYAQKKLIDIESYLMHAGQPWKKQNILDEPKEDQKSSANREPQLPADRQSHLNHATTSRPSKSGTANPVIDYFSPSMLKKWAVDDLSKTITWLRSQEEKPEESEIKKIAAEGILTCIQDAINSLEKKEDMHQVIEQWSFLPRVVEELAKLEKGGKDALSFPKEELHKQALICKKIYEEEFKIAEDDSVVRKRKQIKADENNTNQKKRNKAINGAQGYDSDDTIEMTEEEIEHGYNTVASKLCK
ncbi:DNA-repair protein XRCC1 [Impatiens glandulifera]|uniref:DNA-repair protein XRCC1 n=1 Tax=Impatiens glandulifera TaxID=253017 RepID=UPI001FB0ACC7|nr:DNA-repair protein XRCC1 [Impatiens glandulifera]